MPRATPLSLLLILIAIHLSTLHRERRAVCCPRRLRDRKQPPPQPQREHRNAPLRQITELARIQHIPSAFRFPSYLHCGTPDSRQTCTHPHQSEHPLPWPCSHRTHGPSILGPSFHSPLLSVPYKHLLVVVITCLSTFHLSSSSFSLSHFDLLTNPLLRLFTSPFLSPSSLYLVFLRG